MTRLELVTDGLQFPEGPIALADGSVLLVEIKAQSLSRVFPAAAPSDWCTWQAAPTVQP